MQKKVEGRARKSESEALPWPATQRSGGDRQGSRGAHTALAEKRCRKQEKREMQKSERESEDHGENEERTDRESAKK